MALLNVVKALASSCWVYPFLASFVSSNGAMIFLISSGEKIRFGSNGRVGSTVDDAATSLTLSNSRSELSEKAC